MTKTEYLFQSFENLPSNKVATLSCHFRFCNYFTIILGSGKGNNISLKLNKQLID